MAKIHFIGSEIYRDSSYGRRILSRSRVFLSRLILYERWTGFRVTHTSTALLQVLRIYKDFMTRIMLLR